MKKTKFNQRALIVVDAIIEHKTATAAADALNVSPGAVYYVLRKLQRETGKRFFTRTRTGLVPDEHALALHQKRKDSSRVSADRKVFIITTFSPIELYIGLQLIELKDEELSLHFQRMPLTTEQRLSNLKSHFVDIDIGHELPEDRAIISHPCIKSELCVLVSKGHSTITHEFTKEDWHSNSHLVWLRGNEGIADMIANRQEYHSIFERRKIAAESANLLAMAHTCANSEHIMLVPKKFTSALKKMFPVKAFDLPWDIPLSFTSYIHIHRSNTENVKKMKLLHFLHDIFTIS